MIDVHTEKNESTVKMMGSAVDLISECLAAIRGMVFSMEQKDKMLGLYVKHTIELEIKRGRLFKRLDTEALVDLTQEGMKNTMELVEDALKDFPEE